MTLPSRLQALKHVVLDMDGTIYVDERLFEETRPFLRFLARQGIGHTFITNNNSRSREEYAEVLRRIGLPSPAESLITSAHATAEYLRQNHPGLARPYVLGTRGLVEDLGRAGYPHEEDNPDCVVVGFDRTLTYQRLARVSYLVVQGLPYLATHPDRTCPTNEPTVLPDCGAICALLESATGRKPDATPGKPSPAMLLGLAASLGLAPGEMAMVGDRIYTDMKMAKSAGVLAVLTLTGEATREQLAGAEVTPDLVVENLLELSDQIGAARPPLE